MAELKKRAVIRTGISISHQTFNEDGAMMEDYIVSDGGWNVYRLEPEEAVLIQNRLNDELADDLLALQKKVMKVMAEFGKEVVIGTPPDSGKPKPR
jgi:hypothetical protein